ncbi:putative MFS family arabinose efflux permease [Thermocatellispora tengchongensis]|uniref:Putative MFS family arabinose efflux permease n=1 Tax=Thermocatellispora tengchongensis TaxID=1073253 RepID=A0A840PQ56_9ACTN|nr:hypothetical protein [Thermocatellispora tengchongensis]MBB5140213.1 putative MFS family arabinose efflux permease [Thermocatellispora tengchongensis]
MPGRAKYRETCSPRGHTPSPAATAGSSSYTSMFNLAIALGALVGGIVADRAAIPGVLWVGGGVVALTTLAVATAWRAGRAGAGR